VFVIGDNPLPEISVMALLGGVGSGSLRVRGPHRLWRRQHKGGGTDVFVIGDNPLPENSLWRLLGGVGSGSLRVRGELKGVGPDRE